MKKLFALLSSLLVIAGVKAQTTTTIIVKKETVKPMVKKPDATSVELTPGSIKKIEKPIKFKPATSIMPVKVKIAETVAKPIKC